MKYKKFGKLDWNVSQVGYGMWGMAGWSESDDKISNKSLDRAIELGCNFFDTAWGYAEGRSEQILAGLLKRHSGKRLYTATKIPPKIDEWPPNKSSTLKDIYPSNHIVEYTEKSLKNLGVETIDLQQFHVWEDSWAERDEWKEMVLKLKQEGKVQSFGISVNRWEPANCLKALESGLIDSIQVIYNIFDQSPEDVLFPYCEKNDIAVIARVPFDEGSLTGKLSLESKWDIGDFRNIYFGLENLPPTIERIEKLKELVQNEMPLAELALRFIAAHPAVTTMIPGMRQLRNVEANMRIGDGQGLSQEWIDKLRDHRWDRLPTNWSC
ncbi:aryl-alcohol dehydrogenase-like predicted oxidoreductase [Aquimarina sp. EL_43]|uniref:aldo/keto reductase n=1 Tax=unclassified Aquimarina TaxID=2627091 RepID=UPI0018CAFB4E|nr:MULTISPECIES: aldo/keto reductase [unclassified Aquimarina]MBG6131173.1 aryl-alcohol dehydrogenase-like predicted oxidoreductase [Aquimarina sp. EL_35]MBG6151632.1 aryl-alcohol dehydrogenase-like predicted oxidoreductase [Aquimarina sp. EL_32]MBG6169562.1 aryl-alcohol dehydrogenase-like predicted oxidoreductase [Aquimarina sp. EL_43]